MNEEQRFKHELWLFVPLAISGGFFEIYAYMSRGGIFANAQTGNLAILFKSICAGSIWGALYCMVPIILYMLAIFVTMEVPARMKNSIKWTELCVLIEMIIILFVGFIPETIPGRYAVLPIFFMTALQYNTFKSMRGQAVSTVFCTNNLRQVVIHYWRYKEKKDLQHIKYMNVYVIVLLSFGFGVILGFFSNIIFEEKAIWVCEIFMLPVLHRLHVHGKLFIEG